MDLADAIALFLAKPGAEETTPFGPDVLVYKVGGKMFALAVPDEFPVRLNLKCDPERALTLRDEYQSIILGYYAVRLILADEALSVAAASRSNFFVPFGETPTLLGLGIPAVQKRQIRRARFLQKKRLARSMLVPYYLGPDVPGRIGKEISPHPCM